jgi:hypothetical protein
MADQVVRMRTFMSRGGPLLSSIGNHSKAPGDQKTLNEELIAAVVEIAKAQPQYAVELFGIPHGVATRLAALSDTQLDDLATTPVALWTPALTERQVRRLPERASMPSPAFEAWRHVTERINRLALATFVRYADDPASAALVCDLRDRGVIRALQELPAFAFLEWGGNAGVPLVQLRLSEAMLDRLLRVDRAPVEPGLRGLAAFVQATEAEFSTLHGVVQEEARRYDAASVANRRALVKRAGRPASNFLMPATSSLILMMLQHQMRPTEVEDRLLATNDVRAAQLRGIAEALNPRPRRAPGAPRDRSRDHRDLWGSAYRRLTATAIFRLQQRLVEVDVEPFEAMVRAFDYYVCTYDTECGVTLSRMLKDVHTALREGTETHLSHCSKCAVVHLSHEEKAGIIECPVCVLARAGKFGQRRPRPERTDRPDRPDPGDELSASPPRVEWGTVVPWPSAIAAETPSHGSV